MFHKNIEHVIMAVLKSWWGKKGAIIFSNDHWTISLDSIVIIQKWVRGNSRGYGFESKKVFFT